MNLDQIPTPITNKLGIDMDQQPIGATLKMFGYAHQCMQFERRLTLAITALNRLNNEVLTEDQRSRLIEQTLHEIENASPPVTKA